MTRVGSFEIELESLVWTLANVLPLHYRLKFVIGGPRFDRTVTQDSIPALKGSDWDVSIAFAAIGYTADYQHVVAVVRQGLGGVYWLAFESDSGRLVEVEPFKEEFAQVIRAQFPSYFL